jgi:SAM-dependent methyltransferase
VAGQAADRAAEIAGGGTGLARSARLFRLFRSEQGDPEGFYGPLARDSVAQVEAHSVVSGATVVDVGGGPGWFTEAFEARGARCCLIEPDAAEMHSRSGMHGRKAVPAGAVRGDGLALPVRDGAADITFSSNVLEHVPDPRAMISEMIRVTRPGGLVYLAFTNWYSPLGGHELSPWHYLGAGLAERRYARRYQRQPKHRVGTSLYRVHIGQVLRLLRERGDIEIVDARPRYYPLWCRPLVRVPGVREVVTWNLLLILRRAR